ncbi:T9SS type A sorting domain-containing protein [Marinilongibacter aquaticus]|uniref:T9SS type A sorting domain-containing protein n=1 Tax=Marinilongibacter aquaticus TaxID=2975157 RepID=UPI0021BDA756|nr:T9SS type A sorting domain-containing protein [Marinilongibacter aquaticus]UBM59843.1 T9SS type A sorting domain-containing protein [Marinilongibacter aquaticus]
MKNKGIFLSLLLILHTGITCAQGLTLEEIPRKLCYQELTTLHFTRQADSLQVETCTLFRKINDTLSVSLVESKGDSITFKAETSGQYYLKANNLGNESNLVSLQVDTRPSLFLFSDLTPFCEGYSGEIRIYQGLQAGDAISWFKDDVKIENQNQDILTVGEAGTYTATVNRQACEYAVNGYAEIETNHIPQAKLSTVSTPEVCNDFVVNLNATLPNLDELKLQWLLDGDSLNQANSSIFPASKTGYYQLQLQQGACVSLSDPILVNVGSLSKGKVQTLPFIAENNSLAFCEGNVVTLRTDNYSKRNDISFSWLKDGIEIENQSGSQIMVSEPGLYRYRLKQGQCEVLSEPLEISYGANKGIKAVASSLSSCTGRAIPLYATAVNSQITNSLGYISLWKDGEMIKDSLRILDRVDITESGNYFFTGSIGGQTCQVYSDTLQFTFGNTEAPFRLLSQSSIAVCDTAFNLTSEVNIPTHFPQTVAQRFYRNGSIANNVNASILDDYFVQDAGTYRIEIDLDSTCTYVSEPLEIKFNRLSAEIISQAEALCVDQLNTLKLKFPSNQVDGTGLAIDGSQFDIQWFKDDTLALGKFNQQYILDDGSYSAQISYGECQTETSPFNVRLIELDRSLLPSKSIVSICPEGGYINLISNEIADNYQWLNNSLDISGNDYVLQATDPGSYRVWIEKDGCGVMSNEIRVVEGYELPTASISGSADVGIGNEALLKIDFTSSAPWQFTLSDGQVLSTDNNPEYIAVSPNESTIYTVTSVENTCGEGTTFGDAEIKIIILGNEPEALSLEIYPNPSAGRLKVNFPQMDTFEADYSLFHANGKNLENGTLNSSQNELDFSRLHGGMYILKISQGENSYSRKIVIR